MAFYMDVERRDVRSTFVQIKSYRVAAAAFVTCDVCGCLAFACRFQA